MVWAVPKQRLPNGWGDGGVGLSLTVLGRSGPYPEAGGACSGYLVTAGGTRVLVDCGNGITGNLLQRCSLAELDAIVLSHLHPDHVSDLYVMRHGFHYQLMTGVRTKGPIPVYAPREPAGEFARLAYPDSLDVRGYWLEAGTFTVDPGTAGDGVTGGAGGSDSHLIIGDLRFTFAPTRHAIPCFAMAIEAGGRRLVYSADTGLSPEVEELARGAHLFLCEANMVKGQEEAAARVGHLTGEQAARMAADAGVERLVLTHLLPDTPPQRVYEEARAVFPGSLDLATVLHTYEV